jgi:hypothetical protein
MSAADEELLARVRQQYGEGIPAKSYRDDRRGDAAPPTPAVSPARAQRAKGRDRKQEEHALQVALFVKVNDVEQQIRRPALALVFAVPNGSYRTIGAATRLKMEGVKPGPPDVWCPVPRGGYTGLVIEMKAPGGSLSPEQADWLSALAREGWKTAVHTTDAGAWAELIAYLDLPGVSRR